MEFEKNKPTTAEDISLASAPRVTLEPTHHDLRSDIGSASNAARPDNRNFEFETESTADMALVNGSSKHPHRHLALLLSVLIVVLFMAIFIAVYLLR